MPNKPILAELIFFVSSLRLHILSVGKEKKIYGFQPQPKWLALELINSFLLGQIVSGEFLQFSL